jgi:hypothetical protein
MDRRWSGVVVPLMMSVLTFEYVATGWYKQSWGLPTFIATVVVVGVVGGWLTLRYQRRGTKP